MKALLVPDIDGDPGGEPGAIEMRLAYQSEQIAGIGFRCPCGCGSEGYLPIRKAGWTEADGAAWDWDGDEVKPTLSPSVYNSGLPCKWHGYLRNGEWSEC